MPVESHELRVLRPEEYFIEHELFSAIAESEFDPVVDLGQRQGGVHRFEPDPLAEGLVAAQHPGAVWATRV